MNAKQLIQSEDFMSARIQIKLRNTTSKTSVSSINNSLQLVEILSSGLALSAPKNVCAIGHILELEFIIINLTNNPFEFAVLGKTISVEHTSDQQDRIEIELTKISNGYWQDFCKLLSNKQDSIDEFFRKVRGY